LDIFPGIEREREREGGREGKGREGRGEF